MVNYDDLENLKDPFDTNRYSLTNLTTNRMPTTLKKRTHLEYASHTNKVSF